MHEPFKASLLKVLDSFAVNPGYLGTIIYGSVVESVPRPDSDIDLIVVTSGGKSVSESRIVGGCEVNIFTRDLVSLCREVAAYSETVPSRDIGAGRLVEWADDLLLDLKAVAERNLADGPRPLSESELFLMGAKYSDAFAIFDRGTLSSEEQKFLALSLFDEAVLDYFRVHRIHFTKWAYILPKLEKVDREFRAAVARFLDSAVSDTVEPLRNIVEKLLTPLGELTPGRNWSSYGEKLRAKSSRPSEWKIGLGREWVAERDTGNNWDEIAAPEIGRLRSGGDDHLIGIAPESALGQVFSFLPPAYGRDCPDLFFLDSDPNNGSVGCDLDEQTRALVRELATDANILAVIANCDNDEPIRRLTVIDERLGESIERRAVESGELEIRRVCFSKAFAEVIERSSAETIRALESGKAVFSRHPAVPFVCELAEIMTELGPPPMFDSDMVLLRRNICQKLKDSARLFEQGNFAAFAYNNARLLREGIRFWYDASGYFRPADHEILMNLSKLDLSIYEKVIGYLGAERNADQLDRISDLVNGVLEPFGGKLENEWRIQHE